MFVEICQHKASGLSEEDVIVESLNLLRKRSWQDRYLNFEGTPLHGHVDKIDIIKTADNEIAGDEIVDETATFCVYQLNEEGRCRDILGGDGDDCSTTASADHYTLPSAEFDGLWESLIYDDNIKERLLDYSRKALLFSEAGVNSNIVSWNRVLLLHGPPGTGKTSLCKALAQKLSIRMRRKYPQAILVEVNSHRLFSKYFSESGKLVTKLFETLTELCDDAGMMVIILIDEVESLAHCRKISQEGTEPADSIRVVNALLTQIDLIKRYPNVLVLATSNLSGSIDLAFVDRADIRQYIATPSCFAAEKILRSCLDELIERALVLPITEMDDAEVLSGIARSCEGLSGRALRKLPFIAHALFVKKDSCSAQHYFGALEEAIGYMRREQLNLNNKYSE